MSTIKLNWYRSAQYCRYHGMDLASISSKEENDELIQHINNHGFGQERFWTSGTDLGKEGSFFWMSSGRPLTYNDWVVGQPDNSKHKSGDQEDCLELWNYKNNGLKWNDAPCVHEIYFICEIQF